jgi:hypothetical protein
MSAGHTAAETGIQLSDPIVIVSILAAVELAALVGLGIHHYHTKQRVTEAESK